MKKFDFVILGGGAAAFAAAIRANRFSKKTAIINHGLPLGGTCVNVGCVPSKTLIHAAHLLHQSKNHGVPGISFKVEDFSFSDVIANELALVDTLRAEKYESVLKDLKHVTLFEGHGSFVDDHTIEVNSEQIQGEKIFIATGSTAHGIPAAGIEEVGYIDHIDALRLKKQPKSLIIIGAGPVGLEFAQMFSRFGTRVTILQRNERIMPPAEPELTQRLQQILESEGIDIYTSTTVSEIKKEKNLKVVSFEQGGKRQAVSAEEIMVAAGKTANTDGIGLDMIGIKTNDHKSVVVNDVYQTNIPHIYAAGDVAAHPLRMETTAGKEGTYVAENALAGKKHSIDYNKVPWTVFTDPELAGVGLTDAEANKRGLTCSCRTVSFEMVPKAHIIRDTRGLIKLVVNNKTRQVLGIHMLAPHAGDLIAQAMMIVENNMTIDDLVDSIPMFPTLSEAIKIVALAFDQDLNSLSCCT